MTKYKLAAMGGTFDRFHKGHRTLISFAFEKAEKVYIGVTNERMAKKNKELAYCIESYEKRVENVKNFVKEIGKINNLIIVKLNDIFGPTLEDKNVDCLVCSPLTLFGSKYINKTREEKGLIKLPIEVCKLEKCDDGIHLSSTRIRKGEVNREGFVYKNIFVKDIIVAERIKKKLKKPFGLLIKNDLIKSDLIKAMISKNALNVAVGDTTSWFMIKNNISVDLSIFDNKTKRMEFSRKLDDILKKENLLCFNNPAGVISKNLFNKIEQCVKESKNLLIDGEEDLAVIPAILYLPLESVIAYGQPDQGLVIVKVNEEIKEWCRKILSDL